MDEIELILGNSSNVTKVQKTYFTSKVVRTTTDLVTNEVPSTEYADKITELSGFLMFLLDEKGKLYKAIQKTKSTLDIDIDSETALNTNRQEVAKYFRTMNNLRSSEKILVGEGIAYTFNSEGNQVPFKCDLKKVTTINFDRNKIKGYLEKLNKLSDTVSEKLDTALVTSKVEYNAPFDVNSSLNDVFENYLAG